MRLCRLSVKVAQLTRLIFNLHFCEEQADPLNAQHLTPQCSKLVKFRKAGKIAYYKLDDHHIAHLLDEGFGHIEEML